MARQQLLLGAGPSKTSYLFNPHCHWHCRTAQHSNLMQQKFYTLSVNVFAVRKILMERDLSGKAGATTNERRSLQEAAERSQVAGKKFFLAADARKRGTRPAAEDSYVESFDPPVHAHPWLHMCSLVTPARYNTKAKSCRKTLYDPP